MAFTLKPEPVIMPGFRALLDDIRAKRIDIVVVYKVDRLTRSLADFAKLVELFDAHGVSFVSVTQSFNTTTSMGRLTLNVLLSFAQLEREVRRSDRAQTLATKHIAQYRPQKRSIWYIMHIYQILEAVWCRLQESNPRPTDYKFGGHSFTDFPLHSRHPSNS